MFLLLCLSPVSMWINYFSHFRENWNFCVTKFWRKKSYIHFNSRKI
jgi:hypothetical protein